jgi:hypothetical protein
MRLAEEQIDQNGHECNRAQHDVLEPLDDQLELEKDGISDEP